MEHTAFVDKYLAKKIVVSVDRNKAGFMYGDPHLMPKKFRTQQAMIRTAAFGGVLVGVALFFIAPWWLALGVLLVGFFMFPKAQMQAAAGVLEASLKDSHVYRVAMDNKVLVINELS